jgi:hypothetical protein
MLLQADKRHLVQGASTVAITAAETVPDPGFSGATGRDPADSARVRCGSRPTDHEKWLVGLEFYAHGRPVWLYYVIDEAVARTHAVHMAVRRAHRDPDRVARGGVQAEADHIEVQRIVRDAIGRRTLARSLPPSRPCTAGLVHSAVRAS